MTVTIRQLAELVHGAVIGDGGLVIQAARPLQDAQPGDITFVENEKNGRHLPLSQASAAVAPATVPPVGKTLIVVADPLMAFAAIYQHLHGKPAFKPLGIDVRADVHPSVQIDAAPSILPWVSIGEGTIIGKRCHLHSGVVVGKNCRIGDDVVLYPNVVLYDEVVLGARVVIHANSVIGADGFGFRLQQGRHVKVPQFSNVIIGADVEIGASSCVDRGTFRPTCVGEGTKFDNFVQIGHNCQIGKHNLYAAGCGIGGSTTTGNYVAMGGYAAVRDHLHIGDGVQIGARSGVVEDVPAGKRMFLYPAYEEHHAARILACLKKLPSMRKDLLRVLKELNLSGATEAPTNQEPHAPAA